MSKTGAVSMKIEIGSSYEPNEINGLTHFLEHSLLLGTEKYPKIILLTIILIKIQVLLMYILQLKILIFNMIFLIKVLNKV